MRVLALGGCGAMGTEVVRDLVATSDFESIVVADIDIEKATRLIGELDDKRLHAVAFDVTNKQGLIQLMKGFNVVANCTTYHYGVIATEAAIEAKVNYLDLGGLYNTPKQLALNEAANRAGITAVLGCGATPGVTNLLARYGADQLDYVEAIHIAFASFRDIAPSRGLLDTVLDEFSPSTNIFYYDEGKLIQVPPFSGAKEIEFRPPIGKQITYYVPHSEIHTLSRFIKGVHRVDVRGTWRPEIMAALQSFYRFRLLHNDPIQVQGVSVGSRDFLKAHFLQSKRSEDGEWAFLLNVEVVGSKGDKKHKLVYNTSHPTMSQWGKTATARMTGISASIGAQLIAKGQTLTRGVVAPETCFAPSRFLSELARRGIYFHDEVSAG